MSTFANQYRLSKDQYGLAVITINGRCLTGDIDDLELNTISRYKLVPLPQASGAIFKSLDGVAPVIYYVTVPAFGTNIQIKCVKVRVDVNPFAIRQVGGPYDGYYVHRYELVYQQVGDVA